MIDIATEKLMSLKEAAESIPSFRDNRPCSPATLSRLIKSGKLEGLRFGGRWITSMEAIQRMVERDTRAALGGNVPAVESVNLDAYRKRRAAELARAERLAEKFGI